LLCVVLLWSATITQDGGQTQGDVVEEALRQVRIIGKALLQI